jgi:hypothetical protein
VEVQFLDRRTHQRRTAAVLRQIADATTENARHVAEMARLIDAGAEQNAKMVRLSRHMKWLTTASVALAVAAVIVAPLRPG